jgi:hypothetical protein
LKPRRADIELNFSRILEDPGFPQVLPVFQEVVNSNLRVSSVVYKPIAGDQNKSSLEDRYLKQIGKTNFVDSLLPPKQTAPPMVKGENKIHIKFKNFKAQIQIDTYKRLSTKNLFRTSGLVYTCD